MWRSSLTSFDSQPRLAEWNLTPVLTVALCLCILLDWKCNAYTLWVCTVHLTCTFRPSSIDVLFNTLMGLNALTQLDSVSQIIGPFFTHKASGGEKGKRATEEMHFLVNCYVKDGLQKKGSIEN